jgi:phytoene/squalene synthetase
LADEIVDSFHGFDKRLLLHNFSKETFQAIENRVSTNPVLQSFQKTVHAFNIGNELIDTFLKSMEMDLEITSHNPISYEKYILGSAEVVGLMCLKVFCEGNNTLYEELKPYAMKLGSAFQKVNFLRDVDADSKDLGRNYFPHEDGPLNEISKRTIEREIQEEFNFALQGIKRLPATSKFGVYVAYIYYESLLKKIKSLNSKSIYKERIRIPNNQKYMLLLQSYFKHRFNLV